MTTQPQLKPKNKAQKRLEGRINSYMASPKTLQGEGYRKPGSMNK